MTVKRGFEMGFTNSSLVGYTNITSKKTARRAGRIDRITPHCIVGQWTAKRTCDYFANTDRECSTNYVIGSDGVIGLCVDEKDRSWCSSSYENDDKAVTIECASDVSEPYEFKANVYERLIELCTDICRRNGKNKLIWFGDKGKALSYNPKSNEMILTVHRWFAYKSCPGTWMYNRMGELAEKVTTRLGGKIVNQSTEINTTTIESESEKFCINDVVSISTNATYYSGGMIPAWVKAKKWIIKDVDGDRAVIDRSEDGKHSIFSPINIRYLIKGGSNSLGATTFEPYKVSVSINDLNVRKGAGVNFGKNGVCPPGIYTIISESKGPGASKWGKLKSGIGWISLDYVNRI